MGLGQILVLWLGIMAGTVFPILLVLWIVYLICEPGRKRAERKRKAKAAERECIEAALWAEDRAWMALGVDPPGYERRRWG